MKITERGQNLIGGLTKSFNTYIESFDFEQPVGSMTLWYDEYGANLDLSPWKYDDFTYSVKNLGNASIDGFDTFSSTDISELDKVIAEFFTQIKDSEQFKKLKLRNGFRFVSASFDDNQELVLDALNANGEEDELTGDKAVEIVTGQVLNCLSEPKVIGFKEIQFTCEEGESVIYFICINNGNEEYLRYSTSEYNVGLALTCILKDREDGFEKLCMAIGKEVSFQSKVKHNDIFFVLQVSGEEYFCCGHDQASKVVKNLDEEMELKLRYSE